MAKVTAYKGGLCKNNPILPSFIKSPPKRFLSFVKLYVFNGDLTVLSMCNKGGYRSQRSGRDKYGPPVRTEFRLIVENLSSRCSWQDLKVSIGVT